MFNVSLYSKTKGNALTLEVSRKKVYWKIIEFFDNIEKLDKASIVRGFFEGDGTVNLKRKSLVMNQSLKNRKKLELISRFLKELGIYHKLYILKKLNVGIIEIFKRDDIVKFFVLVGTISKSKEEKIKKILEKKVFKVSNSFYSLENPKISTSYYKGKVYDLTLEGDPYYFANGILTHNSMYPSIMISFNICPTTLLKEEKNVEFIESPIGVKFVSKKVREGIFPQILKKLIEERDVVKKQMKKETDKERKRQLDAKQYALKVMANAFYGYTGYIKARLYILDIANAITSFGRYLISQTKKIVEEDPRFQVVYGDTDSVMVLTPTLNVEEAFKFGKELEEKINSRIGHLVKMKIEAVFKTLLILTKKRYAGLVVEKVNDKYEE